VLLLGRTRLDVSEVHRQLNLPEVRLAAGIDLEDVRRAFSGGQRVDHVVMGAGIDLDARLAIVREVFAHSTVTTVHLKDTASGREGFLAFVRGILTGLRDVPLPG
jgi:hypothetical protein